MYSHSAKGPWNKSVSYICPIKYVIPKGLKVGHVAEHFFILKSSKNTDRIESLLGTTSAYLYLCVCVCCILA